MDAIGSMSTFVTAPTTWTTKTKTSWTTVQSRAPRMHYASLDATAYPACCLDWRAEIADPGPVTPDP